MIEYKLSDVKPNNCVTVVKNNAKKEIRRRLMDIGLIENTLVECVGRSPGGGISAFLIRGAVIALRDEDSCDIIVGDAWRSK